MKSVALHNLGCKVNGYEMDVIQQMLQERGYKIVPFDGPADIYIVNTCTVTNIADRKSRQMLHRAKKNNPQAVVVAAGCYVNTGEAAVEKDDCVDLAVANRDKMQLVDILDNFLSWREGRKTRLILDPETQGRWMAEDQPVLLKRAGHTRAYIKIQDGCNQFCSYCIIPYARGRVRSRRAEEIREEIAGLAASGYKEVVLTGIHISSYGTDRKDEGNLVDLLRLIHGTEGIERIRLGSLEPGIVTEEFVRAIAGLDKVCPHFHLSLQSGCDETLRRMNRHYTAGEYYEKVEMLRGAYSHPAVTTDVIVGFPGETEEEFGLTRDFLDKVGFYETHIFKYSRRKGTAADRMPDQVPEEIKAERSAELIAMSLRHSREYRDAYIGSETKVLFEEEIRIGGELYQVGHTREYVKAAVPAGKEKLDNRLLSGRLLRFLKDDILLMEPEEAAR